MAKECQLCESDAQVSIIDPPYGNPLLLCLPHAQGYDDHQREITTTAAEYDKAKENFRNWLTKKDRL